MSRSSFFPLLNRHSCCGNREDISLKQGLAELRALSRRDLENIRAEREPREHFVSTLSRADAISVREPKSSRAQPEPGWVETT